MTRPSLARRRRPSALTIGLVPAAIACAWYAGLAAAPVHASATVAPTSAPNGSPPTLAPPARHRAPAEIRVALATASTGGALTGEGSWQVVTGRGRLVVRARTGERWTVESSTRVPGGRPAVRLIRPDGTETDWKTDGLVVRPADADRAVRWNGAAYRGELRIVPTDSGAIVLNALPLDDYLRGVVPLELSRTLGMTELAAYQAQAVAARTFTLSRASDNAARAWDVRAGTLDQVYGGRDVETRVADLAVSTTSGMVVEYAGRLVFAPYHSTCGGTTASAEEVWRTSAQPWLQRVSDRVPGSSRSYCDISPRFRWTRTIETAELQKLVDANLSRYARVPAGGAGAVRLLQVDGVTLSGRAAGVLVGTDRGRYHVRGNDVRFVLRDVRGEILPSTYFSVNALPARGRGPRVTIDGSGAGHGIGMCQWGAIGRARAGQDFRTILRTYYPGTSIGHAS